MVGLRPTQESVKEFTTPPYDIINKDPALVNVLKSNPNSLYHIILGDHPKEKLDELIEKGVVVEDREPCFYVIQQNWNGHIRLGVFVAGRVSDYSECKIIRHEKTFDELVQGRIKLRRETGYSFGPVFLISKSGQLDNILQSIVDSHEPLFEFTSEFTASTHMHDIANKVYRVPAESDEGREIKRVLDGRPLYVGDGHHRYQAGLTLGQTHFLAYVCTNPRIEAYNRVMNGRKKFADMKDELGAEPINEFKTPEKHCFSIYTRYGTYLMRVGDVPADVVGRLDPCLLEKTLYPKLGLTLDMITDRRYFNYYPEHEMDEMRKLVDIGEYDIAVAMHPVSLDELLAVADAGLENPDTVMPEKSTYLVPKILSGIVVYKHVIK